MLRRRRDVVLIALAAILAALVAAYCSAPDAAVPEVARSPGRVARPAPVVPPPPAPIEPPAPEPEELEPMPPPATTKPRPEGWEDDRVYLRELLALAVEAVDPHVDVRDGDVVCSVDVTRCFVRAPLHDEELDEDTLWDVARAAVIDASAGDAALTRARILEPDGEASLMELEVTLTVD